MSDRIAGKFGKLPAERPLSLGNLQDYVRQGQPLPEPPDAPGYYERYYRRKIPVFPMNCNDRLGCCVISAYSHFMQAWRAITGQVPTPMADADVESTYFHLTGGQDSGLVESRTLAYARSQGIGGYKILAYVPVNPRDTRAVRQAIALFGGLFIGFQVPQSCQAQFGNGVPWLTSRVEPIEGGHAVAVVDYNSDYLLSVTWGAMQRMAWSYWNVYVDEAFAIIPEDFRQAGRGPMDGLNVDQLMKDLDAIRA